MRKFSRRQFCVLTGAGVMATACGSGASGEDAAVRDLAAPSDLSSSEDMTDPSCANGGLLNAGPVTSFANDSATFFHCAHVFVCRDTAGLYAISSACTHEGCDVAFAATTKEFDCPCHLSVFDFNGNVVQDPAKVALPHYAVRLDGSGNVIVDLSMEVSPTTRLGDHD